MAYRVYSVDYRQMPHASPLYRTSALICAAAAGVLALSACSSDITQRSAVNSQYQAGNAAALISVSHFSTENSSAKFGEITPNTLNHAAALTLQHGYRYFLLQPDKIAARRNQKTRPHFNLSYGRNAYGFGDAGGIGIGSAGLDFSLTPFRADSVQADGNQTAWVLYMLHTIGAATIKNIPASSIDTGGNVQVYNARNIRQKPIMIRLR